MTRSQVETPGITLAWSALCFCPFDVHRPYHPEHDWRTLHGMVPLALACRQSKTGCSVWVQQLRRQMRSSNKQINQSLNKPQEHLRKPSSFPASFPRREEAGSCSCSPWQEGPNMWGGTCQGVSQALVGCWSEPEWCTLESSRMTLQQQQQGPPAVS